VAKWVVFENLVDESYFKILIKNKILVWGRQLLASLMSMPKNPFEICTRLYVIV